MLKAINLEQVQRELPTALFYCLSDGSTLVSKASTCYLLYLIDCGVDLLG